MILLAAGVKPYRPAGAGDVRRSRVWSLMCRLISGRVPPTCVGSPPAAGESPRCRRRRRYAWVSDGVNQLHSDAGGDTSESSQINPRRWAVQLGRAASRRQRLGMTAPTVETRKKPGLAVVPQPGTAGAVAASGTDRQRAVRSSHSRRRQAMSFGTDPGATGESKRKAELFMAKADVAWAARLAGHKSPLRRLLGRLVPHRAGTQALRGDARNGVS